jgi:hypothetical protein
LRSDVEEVKRFVTKAVEYLAEEPRYKSQPRKETIDILVNAFVEVVNPAAPALEPYRGTVCTNEKGLASQRG